MGNEERRLHWTYGGLLLVCFLLDPLLGTVTGQAWRSPALSIYPASAALIWLAVWARYRLQLGEGKRRALEERIGKLERRLSELEVDRAPDPRWPG